MPNKPRAMKELKPVQINLVDTVPHGNPLATPTGKIVKQISLI